MAGANGEFSTTIGPDASFKGEVTFDKGLRILGKFEGHIKAKGQLHIGEGAKVQADVDTASVEIDGEMKGNLVAKRRVQLSSSSRLEGDLETARLEIADGAVFVGNCRVSPQSNGKPDTGQSGKKTAPVTGPAAAAKK